jgi:hypothetical protein
MVGIVKSRSTVAKQSTGSHIGGFGMTTNRNLPTRPVTTPPVIIHTRSVSDVYLPTNDGVPFSTLVGRYIHVYGMETFTSDAYGLGVRLVIRDSDESGAEYGEEYITYSFAFRLKEMARVLLGDQTSVPFVPPIRARVHAFGTGRGTSYELIDA